MQKTIVSYNSLVNKVNELFSCCDECQDIKVSSLKPLVEHDLTNWEIKYIRGDVLPACLNAILVDLEYLQKSYDVDWDNK